MLLVEKADQAVALENHCGIGGIIFRDLVRTGPAGGKRLRINDILRDFTIPDSDIPAALAERDRLKCQPDLCPVGNPAGRDNEDFPVAGIADGRAPVIVRSGECGLCPGTGSGGDIIVTVDIEDSASPCTAAENHAAVRKFLALRLVPVACRESVRAAESLPGLAEIIAVDYPVAAGSGAEGRIDAVMASDLDDTALENLARAHETALHTAFGAVVEKRIYLLRDFLPGGPGASPVIAPEHGHPVRIAPVGLLFPVNGLAADGKKQKFIGIPVPHDCRVTEAAVHSPALSRSFHDHNLVRPGPAVVRRDSGPQVHTAETYVGTAMPVVNHGRERTVIE